MHKKPVVIESLEPRRLLSAAPAVLTSESFARGFLNVGNTIYFVAGDAADGQELWKTDGTTAGTAMVKDIYPGLQSSSSPTAFRNVNGELYFIALDPSGRAIYKSDGTSAGTLPVARITTKGTFPLIGGFASIGSQIVYSDGTTLFVSDGSSSGTSLFSAPAIGDFASAGRYVYFAAENLSNISLYRTDGTSGGTTKVADIGAFSASANDAFVPLVIQSGAVTYFTTRDSLYRTDGTAAGTFFVAGGPQAPLAIRNLTDVNGTLYFSSGSTLYESDGSEAGTLPVCASLTGTPIVAGSAIYFFSTDSSKNVSVLKSDSTGLSTFCTLGQTTVLGNSLGVWQGAAYFYGTDSSQNRGVWRNDPGATPLLLQYAFAPTTELSNPLARPAFFTPIGNQLVLAIRDYDYLTEPWITDGTPAGTTILKDVNTATSDYARISGTVYNDANGNGQRDAGESGLAGWTVYAQSDPSIADVTDANGNFTVYADAYSPPFSNTNNSKATLIAYSPDHATPTAPASGVISVPVSPGQVLSGSYDFGYPAGTVSLISGRVFQDNNDNGVYDTGDSALVDRAVTCTSGNNVLTAFTDSQGMYYFQHLAAGTYAVTASPVSGLGWHNTTPKSVTFTLAGGKDKTALDLGWFYNKMDVATVDAFVFNDANQNGTFEYNQGEAGITNVVAYIDLNDNGVFDSGEPSAQTSSDGHSAFFSLTPGVYVERVVPPAGSHITTPYQSLRWTLGGGSMVQIDIGLSQQPAQSASISGSIFADNNGNGTKDSGEAGVGSLTVFLDSNFNGRLDPAIDPSTTADSSGKFAFAAAPAGTYAVQVQPPPGWRETDSLPSEQTTFTAGQIAANLELGIQGPPVPEISGPSSVAEGSSIALDASGSSEIGGAIAKFEWDTNYNGSTFVSRAKGVTTSFSAAAIDGPAMRTVALRVTDSNNAAAITTAKVTITNVPPTAKFTAGPAVKLGAAGSVSFSAQTDPSAADVSAGFKYSYDFNSDGKFEITDSTLASATVPATYLASVGIHTVRGRIKDKDGGFSDYTATITVTAPTLAGISGTVYADNNGNGKKDTSELGVSGRKLYIDKNKNGVLDAGEPTVTTGASGTFAFSGLAAGTYRVRDVLPSGWRRVSPTAGYYDVTVAAGQTIVGKNFAETTRGLISGIVFKDANSNGVKDPTEVGLAGWVVYLDTNNSGKRDPGELSFTTGTDGKFSFVVPAGTYHLREVLQSGFKRTAPSAGVYNITLASGQTVTGKNFGDH
jgi:ELWxxDGT repeat protein